MVFNQKLNPFSFQKKSGSQESTLFDSIYKNALFIFLLIFLSTNTFAQKNIIKVDTAIHYEKVILYACGKEIEILKGEDEYLIGNCYTIDSFKILYAKDTIVLNYGSWKPVHYIETKLYISIPLYKTSNSNKYCIKYFADEEEWANTCKIEPTNVVFVDDSFPMGVKS